MFEVDPDPLEVYAAMYDPDFDLGETVRTPRNPKAKPSKKEAVTQLTDVADGLEAGFEITYKPARFEAVWLLSSLRSFYDQTMITDVVAQVKGGKEASVYRCVAHPSTGAHYLAAKVYRPRMFRNLRNDKMYREGRRILGPDGKTPKERMCAFSERWTRALPSAHRCRIRRGSCTSSPRWTSSIAPRGRAQADCCCRERHSHGLCRRRSVAGADPPVG